MNARTSKTGKSGSRPAAGAKADATASKKPDKDSQDFSRRLGVLTKDDIQSANIISENALEENYKAASYDLRLNNEVLVPDQKGNGYTQSSLDRIGGKKLKIKKYGSAIVCSFEVLKIPKNVIGRFNLRIKIALRGVFVQMGTQVEPGYNGRLFALVHNISDEDVVINLEQEAFFTIEFFFIGQDINLVDEKPAYLSISDILQPGTAFVKGSLGSLVNDAESNAKEALRLSQEARAVADNANSKQRVFWNVCFAAVVAVVASAVAPFMISFAAEKMRATNEETKQLIDSGFQSISADAARIKGELEKSSEEFKIEIKNLKQELDQIRSRIGILTESATELTERLKSVNEGTQEKESE